MGVTHERLDVRMDEIIRVDKNGSDARTVRRSNGRGGNYMLPKKFFGDDERGGWGIKNPC